MSRSFRKTPICGNACASSEKDDKRRANRSLRHHVKQLLHVDPETEVLPTIDEISNLWDMAKDGKQWFGDMITESYQDDWNAWCKLHNYPIDSKKDFEDRYRKLMGK